MPEPRVATIEIRLCKLLLACGESNNALTITGTMYWIAKQVECVRTYLICVEYLFPSYIVRVGHEHLLII